MRVKVVSEGKCHSQIQREMIRFNWTISDVSFVKSLRLESPTFPESAPGNVGRWQLTLKQKGEDNLRYNIWLSQVSKTYITANLKISVINSVGFVPKSEMKRYSSSPNGFAIFENLVERDNVLEKTKGVLNRDKLTIACEITVDNWCTGHTEELDPVESPLSQLVEDMGNLLSSESLTDVTITVGERQFRAHKAILAARSTVFAAMFRNEMVENKNSVVKITDIDSDVFHQVLEHIYTGNEISHTETLIELLAAAEKYNLKGLKLMCERKLCEELTVENVLENLVLADLYKAFNLKEKAVRFIVNHRSDVIESSSWDKFTSSHQHLLKEICENVCLLK